MDSAVFAGGVVILLFSVIAHEVMHGFMALKFGDHTAESAGRLTFNPLPHIDPIGTILVPLFCILPSIIFPGSTPGIILGWAKPVPVNPLNFTNIRKGELFVSSAGIITNFSLAIISTVIFYLVSGFASIIILQLLAFSTTINLILAIFNALPVPPLDGSKILASFLPTKMAISYQKYERYGILILLLLLFFPIGGTTALGIVMSFFMNILSIIFRIPYYL
jgi:Zn-dependent protease